MSRLIHIIYLALYLAVIFVEPMCVFGQDDTLFNFSLDDKNIPVAHHETKSGGLPMTPGSDAELQKKFFSLFDAKSLRTATTALSFFLQTLPGQMSEMGTLPQLPPCPESGKTTVEVFQSSQASHGLDFLYFSPDDNHQVERAKTFGERAIAYRAGETFGITNDGKNIQSAFALMMNIQCLPTRMLFTTSGAQRFFEYRQGDAAFAP